MARSWKHGLVLVVVTGKWGKFRRCGMDIRRNESWTNSSHGPLKMAASSLKRLILLDRDGTLIVEKDYLSDPAGVELIPGAGAALKRLKDAGHKLALISNQSGIARGYFTLEDHARVQARLVKVLAEEGVALDGLYYCPHGPEDGCDCRKPRTGMLEQASHELGMPLTEAVVIGDKEADLEAGKRVGATRLLVRTGYGRTLEQAGPVDADAVVEDLPEAVDWILTHL